MSRATRAALVRNYTGNAPMDRVERERNSLAAMVNDLLRRVEWLERQEPHGRIGATIRNMNNADLFLRSDETEPWLIQVTGALTANKTLHGLPRPKDHDGIVYRAVWNATTGGFTVFVSNGGSAVDSVTAAIPIRIFGFTKDGVFGVTA